MSEFKAELAQYPNAEQFTLYSDKIDENFLIQVGLPSSYSQVDKRYPVVYALDGNIFFGMINDTARLLQFDLIEGGRPELIVVSIGYVKGELMGVLRGRDLVPSGSVPDSYFEETKDYYPNVEVPNVGAGARCFLSFIEKTLDPIIREQYRTDGGKAGILGDSFGGLFTFFAFLEQSPLFNKYWFGSPGLLIEDHPLVAGLPDFLRNSNFGGQQIYLTLGEGELSHTFYRPMGSNYAEIVRHLKENPAENLIWDYELFAGHTHASVVPAAMTQALRFLYRGVTS